MNACIVGYGAIGPVHAEALCKTDGVKVYGICDTVKERADSAAEKYGAAAFYNYDDCIADKNIDFIHICTPHYLHFDMTKKALENGKSVVVEKPVTMTKNEFDSLLRHPQNGRVYPVFQNRTNKCIEKMKEIIENENLQSELVTSSGIVTWHRGADYYNSNDWRGTKKYEGGGVLINQAVHTLDLMIYLCGSVYSASASVSNRSLKNVIDVEDTADAYIKFKSGATGVFFATNAYGVNSPTKLELVFENTSLRYTDGKLYRDGELICCDDKKYAGKSYWGNGHERIFHDLYANKKSISVYDVKETMHTLFALYESAGKNGTDILV